MIQNMYSLYDSKAKAFTPPFVMQAHGLAIRGFAELVNDPKTTPGKYPGDFTLFQVGEWDDGKGEIIKLVPHLNLGLGSSFVNQIPTVDKVVEREDKKVFESVVINPDSKK